MSRFLLLDVGCTECEHATTASGPYDTLAAVEAALLGSHRLHPEYRPPYIVVKPGEAVDGDEGGERHPSAGPGPYPYGEEFRWAGDGAFVVVDLGGEA